MLSSNLIRWAGLANIVGGLLVALGFILHPPEEAAAVSTSMWAISHLILVISTIFGMLGVFGLYARQSEETKLLGLTGFILVFVGTALFLGITYYAAFIEPVLAAKAPEFVESSFSGRPIGALAVVLPLMGLLFSLGWLLLGIGTIRTNILPRWAAILTIIGSVPFGLVPLFIVTKIAAVVFGLGIIWLGYALWSEKRAMTTPAKPAMVDRKDAAGKGEVA
jgi:hypothetical protein